MLLDDYLPEFDRWFFAKTSEELLGGNESAVGGLPWLKSRPDTSKMLMCSSYDATRMSLSNVCDLSWWMPHRIRVDRYDEADVTQGQKLRDLPVVHSNWLRIFRKAFCSP